MKRTGFTLAIASLVLPVLLTGPTSGEHIFFKRNRAKTRCKLPNHNYGHNVWPFTTPRGVSETVIAVAATNPTDVGDHVKPFHFRARSMTLDFRQNAHLTLDQVGLTLYNTGRLYASGRISQEGGDGGLIGSHVVVYLRAYISHTGVIDPTANAVTQPALTDSSAATSDSSDRAANGQLPPPVNGQEDAESSEDPSKIASPNSVNRIPPDAYLVWQSEHRVWVSRARPQTISLVKPDIGLDSLKHHFADITHLEVELEYQRDR